MNTVGAAQAQKAVGEDTALQEGIELGRLVGLGYGEWLGSLMGSLACSAAMAALVWALDQMVLSWQRPVIRLGVDVAVGILTYVILLHVFRVRAYRDLVNIVMEHWRKFRAGVPTPAE